MIKKNPAISKPGLEMVTEVSFKSLSRQSSGFNTNLVGRNTVFFFGLAMEYPRSPANFPEHGPNANALYPQGFEALLRPPPTAYL